MGIGTDEVEAGALRDVSTNRLACLARHWGWADDALHRFERERAGGWDYDVDPPVDHLFGAYYQWCALLCTVGHAILEDDVLSRSPLGRLRPDLDACLPVLLASQRMLLVIPSSREDQPRIVDLLRDGDTLRRLRRIHTEVGQALRGEQEARERDLLGILVP